MLVSGILSKILFKADKITELWGLPGMVLEILRENKAVTSLTVF